MKNRIILFGVLAFLGLSLPGKGIWDSLKIRRSVFDKNTIEKPAQLNLQWPLKEKVFMIADAGVSLSALPFMIKSSTWEMMVAAEYHRNDLKDKLQDTFIGTLATSGVIGDIAKKGYSILPQAAAKFKMDQVKKAKSLVAALDATACFPKIALGRINHLKNREEALGFTWQPKLGIEFEQIVSAKEENISGHEMRPFAAIEVGFYPFQGKSVVKRDANGNEVKNKNGEPVYTRTKLGQRLQIWTSFQYWFGLLRSGIFKENPDKNWLLRIAAQYFFSDLKNIGIGIEYVNGANPSEGMPNQQYIQLSFCIKK